MPLRDHFDVASIRPAAWNEIHGGWPAMMVLGLAEMLPEEYAAGPIIRPDWETGHDEYMVQILNRDDGSLVSVLHLVSPGNKDRPDNRRSFISKCRDLLLKQVSLSIIDVVTINESSLYGELRREVGGSDWPPALSAVSCRVKDRKFEAWEHPLEVGKPFPILPIWLANDLAVPLDLESSYMKLLKALRIR